MDKQQYLDETCLSPRSVTSAANLQPAQVTEPGCVSDVQPSPGRCESQGIIPFEGWKLKPHSKSTSWTSKVHLPINKNDRVLDRVWSINFLTKKTRLLPLQPNSLNFLPQHRRHTGWRCAGGRWHSATASPLRLSLDPTAALGLSGMKAKTAKTSETKGFRNQNAETTLLIPKHRSFLSFMDIYIYFFFFFIFIFIYIYIFIYTYIYICWNLHYLYLIYIYCYSAYKYIYI